MPSVIALQAYTLRDYCKTPLEIARTLNRVKKIGYDAIEVAGFGPVGFKELAKILDGEGLTCCGTHTPFEKLLADPERVIEDHALIQAKNTAPGIMPNAYRADGLAGYKRFALEANLLALKLKPMGLSLSYHNHDFEFTRFGPKTGLEILFSTALALSAELDTYWIQAGGGDPAAWIRHVKGRLPLLHLKDMVYSGDKHVMAEVGEGNLNWPAILQAAADAGVHWYVVEQDTCKRDPFESIAISLANLKAMGLQ